MLAERDNSGTTRTGLQIQVSKLLLTSIVAAIATSVAMVVATVMIVQAPPPPPPQAGGPPPPPMVAPIVTIIVITGMFVVSWLAVLVVLARDQLLRRLRELPAGDGPPPDELLATVREELAADRRADLAELEARLTALTTEYGEQRETDGYVNGMRVATRPPNQSGEVRPLHRR
jgi:hypothetical protein